MRCYPTDTDIFFHMNNANYLANAELARWRTLGGSGDALWNRATSKQGLLFLAVENKVRYIRPIDPMQRYVISTTCTVDNDDKWFYYRHTFQEHPNDAKSRVVRGGGGGSGGADTGTGTCTGTGTDKLKKFAVVDLKAVVKQRDGKTIRPSELMKESDFYRDWITVAANEDPSSP
eukprot:CAMPEP_0197248282 /NCGR_PEP_ID=MMETSP1429-20130617/37160_1 /TAXON_ID=49237 /ORGANISM="Chaetoceros  sp., Strain UNC1202" /LENGTH=174 /DNA_ID=CAMNT_0042709429 /DNA_START=186 /DNA_END=710 /DNA_ORIENTATION=-